MLCMKNVRKATALLLCICLFATFLLFAGCGTKDDTGDVHEGETVEVWTPENILEKPVTADDLRIGSYVSFADTKKGWSAVDQIERYYYAGINFMPLASTIPSAGMLTKEEKEYISRDLTSSLWWGKIDQVMTEYNMVYYFHSRGGLGADFESVASRSSMLSDEALDDARTIIPTLQNCVGVHVVDEPAESAFADCALWARRYAAIKGDDGESLGLDALVNMLPEVNFAGWMEQAGSSVGVLGHDSYPFNAGGTNYDVLRQMNTMRKVANEYGVRLSCFPQSCAWAGKRMPNFEEIEWNINTYLAFGFTQFMYFNYIMYPNEGCYDAVFAMDGSVLHPELHESLTQFHKELRALDANIGLNGLKAAEVYLTSSSAPGGTDRLPDGWIVDREGLAGKDLILSLFMPKEEGKEDAYSYLNIVNNSFETAVEDQEFYLGADSGITGLERYNYKTGLFEKVNLINGSFILSLDKSESVFLRILEDVNV